MRRVLEGAVSTPRHFDPSSIACRLLVELAGYAKRRHFSNAGYNDAGHAFCEGLPWFRLRQLIEEKLNAHGIRCEIVGHTLTEERLTADEHQ